MKLDRIRIGMSGWTFAPWRGKFYPKKWVQKRELEYASRKVSSIEINGTFYSLQTPKSFQSWHDQTPDDFIFSVKAPKYMTHVLRLKDCFEPLCTFMGSGLLCLKQKLGPILWQFPPNVILKDDRFEKFIKTLPHHSRQAEDLARQHSPKIAKRAWTQAGGDYRLRHAFEFRHPSFQHPDFIAMLKEHGIATVFAHASKKAPSFEEVTADFVYMRMQGDNPKYKKGYPDAVLKRIASSAQDWAASQRDVFIYFNNDEKVNSPLDAVKLLKYLKDLSGRASRANDEIQKKSAA